jgi:two-component system, OmpR family, sensor kinase
MNPSRNLQRTLAIRFSCTMFVALLGFALWAYLGVRHTIRQDLSLPDPAQQQVDTRSQHDDLAGQPGGTRDRFIDEVNRSVAIRLLATVVLGTLATALGAGWLARSAVAPVHEITAQARGIDGGVPGQRITANANIAEFHGLTEVLNAMLARLDRASNWHRRIIRDLGHDLRTPITSMRAGLEVALWKERSPDDYRRVLATTLEEVDRLSLISDALVFLGRLESGQVSLHCAELDARAVAREALSRVEDAGGGHTIRLDEPAEPVLVSADARLMTLVLEQLLDNAKRYTPPGSRIELTVAGQGDEALLSVQDNGPGVADEVLPYLFEPFYRNDAARAREGGPGLGLTAAASIVALHGGTISAERAATSGLRVKITLALVDSSSSKRRNRGAAGALPSS